MGKTAKGRQQKASGEPVQQPKISNFFQTGPAKGKDQVLFTELGKSSSSSSSKLSLKKPVVTVGRNQSPDIVRSEVKSVNQKINQSADSNLQICEDQDVVVIPETQMLFSPSPKRGHQDTEAGKLNTSSDILIPDTPDDNKSKIDQRKKIFRRSFLTGSSNLSKPAGLPLRVKPIKATKPSLSNAKKNLLSVSVNFNPKTSDENISENSSDKKDGSEVENDEEDAEISKGEAELVDMYLAQQEKSEFHDGDSCEKSEVMKETNVLKCDEEQVKGGNPEQFIEEDECNEINTDNEFDEVKIVDPSQTPVKIYDSNIPSIKRMSKAGLSPDPKRNMSGKTKWEVFEQLMEEGNTKENMQLDKTGSFEEKENVKKKLRMCGSSSDFVSSKKLLDNTASEICRKTDSRSKGENSRNTPSLKKLSDKGTKNLSQQLGYQMGGSRSRKSQPKSSNDGVKTDDVLGEILQELVTTPTLKSKSPSFTNSTMNGVETLTDTSRGVRKSFDSHKRLSDRADAGTRRSGDRNVVNRLDEGHEIQLVQGKKTEVEASMPKISLKKRQSGAYKQKSVDTNNRSLSADISFTEEELQYFDDLDSGIHTFVGGGADSEDTGTPPDSGGQSSELFTPVIPKLKKSSSNFVKKKSKEVREITSENTFSDEIMESDSGLDLMLQCLTPEPKRCLTPEPLTPSIQRCVTPDASSIRATQNINEFPSQMSVKHTGGKDVEMEIEDVPTQSESQELCEEFDHLTPFKDKSDTESDLSEEQPPCVHFGRHTVKSINRTRDNVTLELEDFAEKIPRLCILEDFWYDTHITEGDIVHVIGQFDDHMTCRITDKSGLIVVNPDRLLSGTSVVSGVFCMRKSILNEKFKGCDRGNVQMLYGSIIHCLFQQVLKKQIQDKARILTEAELIIKQNKTVHDMYGMGVTEGEVLEEIKKYIPQLQKWLEQYTSSGQTMLGAQTKKQGDDDVLITKIKDIEENIWSPRFGVKGKIDLTVEVRKKSRPKGLGEKLTIPLELKTGRPSFSLEHKGQVTLYSMMSSDRRADPKQGLLLYLKEPSMKLIPADHLSQRGLIQLRNEMAHFLDQQVKRSIEDGKTVFSFGRLPDPINNSRTCPKCPHLLHCAAFQRVEERSLPSSHAMSTLVPDTLAHLSPSHLEYFTHWCLMLDLESQANIRSGLRKIWCKTGPQREALGECICRLTLVMDENSTTKCSLVDQKSTADDEMCFIKFTRNWSKNRGFSKDLRTVGLMSGDYVIVSSEEPSMIAVCMGTLQNLGADTLELVTESESLPRLAEIRGVTFRLDKYDGYSTSAILYTNLSRLMADNPRSVRLRSLIIDRSKSEFLPKLSKSDIESVKKIFKPLNKPQKMSILKVLMSKDYILIKGFPGTGKTSTIVALVKVCLVLGLSVLLTSYTHSAVDNILQKLKKDNVTFVRLGKSNKIHPDIRQFSADHLTKNLNTVGELREFYHSQKIVATSCLGVNHPLFTQRRFDVCIVDEASQVLQPACLGPLFSADRFVLVGDPKQLPPVVQSQEARSIGMDESLFQHLDDNGATFDLNLQYRMNSAIMSISNTLVYGGALKCGNDMVAISELVIPDPIALQKVVDKHGWLKQVLLDDPDYKAAVFLNTSNMPARETRDKSGFITNVGEAKIITILVEALTAAGVSVEEIGVIAPYRNQVNVIRDTLRNTHKTGTQGHIEVNTVDQYQGRDKEVILISFARSFASSADQQSKAGQLLKDVRRINVAVTRAKHKLLLVGDKISLQSYPPLVTIMDELMKKQCIVDLSTCALNGT
ncbi:DNA replication ATP-dependent helicase/nuclease DNA2-like isoform X1 [Mizuhopecten yessoensis]|uniref:DNA replication ATP-dependent helicase/nuclease DNA2-like isoform X1 n=1 Tax=Mizuhopecten yessoensis TaxID=6573 RepID=UPI000B45B519|nr:DNA replication ATP-dependent helicase/nuclease DNA2-like isoform X1 [Mizuhopecten yessoensis]XP_021343499.1 DNA replication ATP-dependent helicase/nuclease DNA2-like isoform X1 [Mizuhopecten yessoensis]